MSVWQGILVAGWAIAVIPGWLWAEWANRIGRAEIVPAVVLAGSAAFTMQYHDNGAAVGVVDVLSVTALVLHSKRSAVIGFLYAIAALIPVMGDFFAIERATTYAITDPIGWASLVVLSGVGGNSAKVVSPHRHNSGSAFLGGLGSTALWGRPVSVAVDSRENSGELR